jgi:hypothetical protein
MSLLSAVAWPGAQDAALAAPRVGAALHGGQLQAGDRRVNSGQKGVLLVFMCAARVAINLMVYAMLCYVRCAGVYITCMVVSFKLETEKSILLKKVRW